MSKLTNLSKEQLAEKGWVSCYNRDTFTYCCGGKELGGFECYNKNRYALDQWSTKGSYHENKVYPTKYDAWKAKLPSMRDKSSGFPLMFNVVEDDTPELAQLLREQDDVTEVLKWRNVNTDNLITMFLLTNGADEEYKEKDEEDDEY